MPVKILKEKDKIVSCWRAGMVNWCGCRAMVRAPIPPTKFINFVKLGCQRWAVYFIPHPVDDMTVLEFLDDPVFASEELEIE